MKQYDFTKDPEKRGDSAISVENTPKRKLDLVPRLICLLIALFIWIYMVNLNDTDVTATMTLDVKVVGTESLKKGNMLIYGIDNTTVTITVKGSNRDLKKYTSSDYSATVDVANITTAGRHTLPITIKTPSGSSISTTTTEPASVNLYADYNATKSVPLNVIEGNVIKISSYNYAIEQSSDKVEVSGPKSIIDKIEFARYTIEGEFSSSKSFSGFTVAFYDKNGDYVTVDTGNVVYSTTDITVKMNVTTQSSVPVVVKVTGEGSSLLATPEKPNIILYGDPAVIAQITEYTITLSEAVAGRNVSVTLTSEGLPDGVTVEGEGTVMQIGFAEPEQIADDE